MTRPGKKWLAWCAILAIAASSHFAFGQDAEPLFDQIVRDSAPESAEDEDEIVTDRDSFTPATSVAGRGRVIWETAHSFIDNRRVPETHSFPEMLVRIGCTDWLEFRLGWNYEIGGAGNPVSGNIPSDLPDDPELEAEHRLLYGAKALLSSQEDWRPQSVAILQGHVPTHPQAGPSDLSAVYVFGWDLPNKIVFDNGLRYSTGHLEEDSFNVWCVSSVVKFPVAERWKGHVEYFSSFSDGRENESVQHFFSTGAHYLITSNLEIGVRVGWGLNRDAPNFFANSGLGWRY